MYLLLRVLKFCIDRLSIDNAEFYREMSPGTSPGTHTIRPLRGDIIGRGRLATPTKMARRRNPQ
jgi:hypothetical protein